MLTPLLMGSMDEVLVVGFGLPNLILSKSGILTPSKELMLGNYRGSRLTRLAEEIC